MPEPIPKRKPGRPRNASVDAIAAKLNVTPRRVRQLIASGEIDGSNAGKAEAPGALAPTVASVRLRRAIAEAERAEIALSNERLESRRVAGELMYADDAIRFILSSLEAVSAGLKNAPDRYAARVNPENFELGRRGLQSLVCEVGELVKAASRKVSESGTPIL